MIITIESHQKKSNFTHTFTRRAKIQSNRRAKKYPRDRKAAGVWFQIELLLSCFLRFCKDRSIFPCNKGIAIVCHTCTGRNYSAHNNVFLQTAKRIN